MNRNLYVVTDTEAGWACVRGIYEANDEKQVYQHIADEQGKNVEEIEDKYIVHQQHSVIKL